MSDDSTIRASQIPLRENDGAWIEIPAELLREQKYDVGPVLAKGGMGQILDARDAAIERNVAIKVMFEGHSQRDLVRFIEEAKITGQLEHPNIVPVHELAVDERMQVFYSMKFVNGVTLKKGLDGIRKEDSQALATYTLATLLTVFQKVCDAVAFAHSKGVIHRDLKPENIMLGGYGEVLVMDWGLAKTVGARKGDSGKNQLVDPAGSGAIAPVARPRPKVTRVVPKPSDTQVQASVRENSGLMTLVGEIMGTPQYMSPEQARGEAGTLDARADIYSLGVILYEILALKTPASHAGSGPLLLRVANGQLDPLPRVSEKCKHLAGGRIPDSLAAVAMKALALKPADRYASVGELQADITKFQNGFATQAEKASALKQLQLLLLRHKGVAAMLALLLVASIAFVFRVKASERRADLNAQNAERNAVMAQGLAKTAQDNEKEARAALKEAERQRETARRALARSEISLSEAAHREHNGRAMIAALNEVPEDLRSEEWQYLRARADTSQARVALDKNQIAEIAVGVAAHPKQPGVFAMARSTLKISMIEAATGRELASFPVTGRLARMIYHRALDFSPDGARLAIGGLGRAGIAIWDSATGKTLIDWEGHDIDTVQFNADGTRLISVSIYGDVEVHDAANGTKIWAYAKARRAVFTPDGDVIAAVGTTLKLLDGKTSALKKELPPLRSQIANMILSPDAKTLFYTGFDGYVRGMNYEAGAVTFEGRVTERTGYTRLALGAGGKTVVAGCVTQDGQQLVHVWDTASGVRRQTLLGATGQIEDLSIHPLSSDVLVSGPDTRTWKVETRAPKWNFPGYTEASVFWDADDVFLPAGAVFRLPADGSKNERLWRPDDAKKLARHTDAAGKYAILALTVTQGCEISILRKTNDTIELIHAIQQTQMSPHCVRISPDGERAILVAHGRGNEIYDCVSGARLASLAVSDIQTIHDARFLTRDRVACIVTAVNMRGAADSEERVVLWNALTGERLREAKGTCAMDSLAAASDGKTLAEGGQDKRVRIRDATTLEVLREFRAHDAPITALAFHPQKPILATGSADLTVRLWNTNDFSLIEEFHLPSHEPRTLNFSPSGKRLSCTDGDSNVRVWELLEPGK